MDERLSLVLYGCKLAKDLELNLPNMANQPDILLKSCDDIITVFTNTRERLLSQAQTTNVNVGRQAQGMQQLGYINAGVQEWLRSSSGTHQAMDFMSAPSVQGDKGTYHDPMQVQSGLEFVVHAPGLGRDLGAGGETQTSVLGDAPDTTRASSSSLRQRKRKDDGDKIVTRVPAPQMGNLDVPPEDGYTWRKYGQKEILGSKYPRSYYRCTHQKFYECPARKQVQRLDNDPFTFEVSYRGTHTCHMSSTAPSAGAPNQILTTAAMHVISSSLPMTTAPTTTTNNNWLSMQIFHDFAGAAGSSSGGARFPEFQLPVADMADAMFNSGSTSSNSMDLIFSSMDDKWDSEEKKD